MMNMKFKRRTKISCTLLRVMSELSKFDKQTRSYGTDEHLFDAEIHMIKSVKENEGIHVTGLAELLGVTKGAVSQIIMKLQKKGMIIKDTDPRNLSRLMLRLTSKGEIAYLYHEKFHQELDDLVNGILDKATEDKKVFLKSFLDSFEEKLRGLNGGEKA